jgi:hypothetical protein
MGTIKPFSEVFVGISGKNGILLAAKLKNAKVKSDSKKGAQALWEAKC